MSEHSLPRTLAQGLAFAEAPRWHCGQLWFSDMYAGTVCCMDATGQLSTYLTVPGQPSGLGWLPDGRLLVVSMEQRCVMRLDAQGLVVHADLSHIAPMHCNDMVVDAQGRAYVGNFGFDIFSNTLPESTVLTLVTPDGQARVVAEDVMFPNGSVITPDGLTLIVAETFRHQLTAFDIAADGSLHRRRVWASLGERMPDGMALDAQGALWVACPSTADFVRVHEGGAISARIATSAPAIACALGGEAGDTLFMLTGPVCAPTQALQERSSCIHALQVPVARANHHLPAHAHAG